MKVFLAVTAILAAMSVSAHAGYNPARTEARQPAVVKAAGSSGSYGNKSGYAKGKTYGKSGKSTGYNSGGFKSGRK